MIASDRANLSTPLTPAEAPGDDPNSLPAASQSMEAYLPPPSDVEFDPNDMRIVEQLAREEFDSPDAHRLNLVGHRLSLIGGFEELVCLSLLHRIEHYPFQIRTAMQVMRSMRGRAMLCDEVGLGKTIEAGLILKEYLMRGLVRRTLILTPPALVSQWQEELSEKFDIDTVAHDDAAFRAAGPDAWSEWDRVVASLHTAKRAPHRAAIHKLTYDLVIVDEAHHLRNRATLNWKFVNEIKSKYLLLLTATPAQNDLDDLFNLITLLSPGQLRTATAFRREFVQRGDRRLPKNRTKLRELMMDVMVRNTRSQVGVALPPRRAFTLRLDLSPEERELYDATTRYVRRAYRERSGGRLMAHTLQAEADSSAAALQATLLKIYDDRGTRDAELDKLCALSGSVRASSKVETLLKSVVGHGEKVLVFTRFRETQRFLLKTLEAQGVSCAEFGGNLTAAQKDAQIAAFAADKQALISTDVGSEGRNLQFCRNIVNFDLPWNPMRIEQRVGRIHRIGQTEPVHIFNLTASDTVEDYILEVLESKINMFELVVGEIGEILGTLDDEREFQDIAFELWAQAASREDARAAFAELGEKLEAARQAYLNTKAYDDELFGDEFHAEG